MESQALTHNVGDKRSDVTTHVDEIPAHTDATSAKHRIENYRKSKATEMSTETN